MHRGRKHNRRTRRRTRRHMKGGAGVGNVYESVPSGSNGGASGYVANKVGGLVQQYNNALAGSGSGNQLVISGGRRRRRKTYRKRGGSLGVVYEAIPALTLMAANQYMNGRRKSRRKSRR